MTSPHNTASDHNRLRLGPVEFTPGSRSTIIDAVGAHRHRQRSGGPTSTLVLGYVNPHVVAVAADESSPTAVPVSKHLATADFICIDGIGVSVVLRRRGQAVERVPAHRLLDHLTDRGLLAGSMVVIGIEPTLVGDAAQALAMRSIYPAAGPGETAQTSVVGTLDGFAGDNEVREFLQLHRGVDTVLIGAGSPKSEIIALIAAQECDHAVVFHCGAGSLKVLAGARRHAPRWLNRIGFDWLFRFVREPQTRRRYTVGTITYLRALRRGIHIIDLHPPVDTERKPSLSSVSSATPPAHGGRATSLPGAKP